MAFASDSNEFDDFVTCPVCLSEFDSVVEIRKPKFLPCSHTLCLQCVKGILQNGQQTSSITCPLCRKVSSVTGDVDQLPNNSYALYLVSVKAKKLVDDELHKSTSKESNWCFTCGSISDSECSSGHTKLNLTSSMIANFEALLSVKKDYLKMKKSITPKLTAAIKKKEEFGFILTQILESLESLEMKMRKLQEDNDTIIAEFTSLLESYSTNTPSSEDSENDAFLADLLSFANASSHPDEKLEGLITSMRKSFEDVERKMTSLHNQAELVAKTRVVIQVYDDNNVNLPKAQISNDGSPVLNELSSHADLVLLTRLVIALSTQFQQIPTACPLSSSPPLPPKLTPAVASSTDTTSGNRLLSSRLPSCGSLLQTGMGTTNMTLGGTFFVAVKHLGLAEGVIGFQQEAGQTIPFIQKLGLHCFHSLKAFLHTIKKAVPDAFVILPLAINGFIEQVDIPTGALAQQPWDVGLMKLTEAGPNNQPAATWALIFVLSRYNDTKNAMHLKSLKPAFLLGHVTEGSGVLATLSKTSTSVRPSYTFTLEFK